MVKMETGIDAGPEDLIHQVPGVCEGVLMKAVMQQATATSTRALRMRSFIRLQRGMKG